MDVEAEAPPPQPTSDNHETEITRPFSFFSRPSKPIVTFIDSIKPNNNPALSGQQFDHLPNIETEPPTPSSTFSYVESRNHDQLHHASLIFTSPLYYQNHCIPSSPSSSSSLASHRHLHLSPTFGSSSSSSSSLASPRHLDHSPTFSSLPSSFNYSPAKKTRPKRRRLLNSSRLGEVQGRRGYTDNTSPPPNQTQAQNNTKLVLPRIIELFREQELAKVLFFLILPITAAVINLYNRQGQPPPPGLLHTIVGLAFFGIPVIWNGLLLKETYPRISVAAELLGSYSVILALVLSVACVIPGVTLPLLIGGSVFCFGLCLVSFFLALHHLKN